MPVLIASVVLLYVLFCALAVLVIILYRQFGLVYMGSRRSNELTGPAVGERAPVGLRVISPDSDASLSLDWSALEPGAAATLLLLGGESCPVCEHLLHHLNDDLVLDPQAVRVLLVDKNPRGLPGSIPAPRGGRWQHWRSNDGAVHDAFDTEVSPFAFVIDRDGIVRAKGIVSEPPDILGLLTRAGMRAAAGAPGTRHPGALTAQNEVS